MKFKVSKAGRMVNFLEMRKHRLLEDYEVIKQSTKVLAFSKYPRVHSGTFIPGKNISDKANMLVR